MLMAATRERYVLAEGPFWDAPRHQLLWVDIEAGSVMTGLLGDTDIQVTDRVDFGERVGAVAPAADGSWLVATGTRLVRRSPAGDLTDEVQLLPGGAGRRLNDGKPDPSGTYVVGSLSMDGPSASERLFRVDDVVTVLDEDLTLSNGLAWSPSGRTLYSVDTERGVIFARTWHAATSTTPATSGQRAVAVTVKDGYPDGITVDAEGALWVAVWGAGEVRRYSPTGALLRTLRVPVPHVSSVAFAGPKLNRLVITTASRDLDDAGLAVHPHAGRLFLADPGVTGAPQSLWSGLLPATTSTTTSTSASPAATTTGPTLERTS